MHILPGKGEGLTVAGIIPFRTQKSLMSTEEEAESNFKVIKGAAEGGADAVLIRVNLSAEVEEIPCIPNITSESYDKGNNAVELSKSYSIPGIGGKIRNCT